jgi:RNA polymerase sigma-70 factor (ECF subfamily)
VKTSTVSTVAGKPGDATWEQERVKRAKSGDREAFGELLRHYQPRVFSLVLRWIRHRDEAHELTQEAFLIAFRERHGFDWERPIRPWLFKIAINVCRNHRRRRRPDVGVRDDVEGALWQADVASAETSVIAGEEGEAIRRAIQQLEPEARTLLLLRFFEDMTYDELAAVYARPTTLLKVRLHRAVGRLRRIVERRRE